MENEALELRIKHLEDEMKSLKSSNSDAHREIFQRMTALESDAGKTEQQYEYIVGELKELKAQNAAIVKRLEELSAKPIKRYDTAVTTAISALVGAVIAYFMGAK